MIVLGLILLVAVVLVVRWHDRMMVLPSEWRNRAGRAPVMLSARLYLWYLALVLICGSAVGILVVGTGGRLAMRLLAATSPDAQGQITEAQEVVGDISFGGTMGFILFGGLPFGMAVAAAYVVLHRALPRGAVGGAALGLFLLIALGVISEPLRPENPDFGIVGPGWLAVAVFTLLALVTGASVAVSVARVSQFLPLPRWSALLFLPLAVLATAAGGRVLPVAILIGGAIIFVLVNRLIAWPSATAARVTTGLRVALVVTVLATLPRFLTDVASIVQ
jgi:hypothetical protein